MPELDIEIDVLARGLEGDTISDAAPLEISGFHGYESGRVHDPVVHVMDLGSLCRGAYCYTEVGDLEHAVGAGIG